ncbi:hypothetical protein BAAM0483_05005 [Bifidobacterium animalis subsp. animalis MCC 0483]|uniref:Type I-E CRISPR-associated protein Cse1/CasA n=1 Tax=Bifidobacterium animalis subsp. animalis MCC 0483 TaxID=1365955 RepID=A0AB34T8K4_9BIFI|nr:type I-E CRISPR-associated protein Cse1/CasA [Bifidobacterium animalis]KOA49506.1 hypothetical protein BAAM0483_05005 [Bifidobacterium animalis subsp. animalis MCC 0483]
MPREFNLIHEPWFRVMLRDGTNMKVGVAEAIARAGDIMIVADHAATRLAIMRLLAAIHARALTVAGHVDDPAHMQGLWDADRLDTDAVDTYLHAWERRFDLFDPERPFIQDPSLRVAWPKPARTLYPWNRDRAPFGPALDMRDTLPPGDAAVGILLDMAYDTSGIKPAPGKGLAYAPVPGVRCDGWPGGAVAWVPQTGSLARDILAMTPMPYNTGDLPVWEHDITTDGETLVRPAGMVQAWTLPTRRINLHADEDGMVRSMSATYGVVPDPTVMYDVDPLVTLNARTGRPLYHVDDTGRPLWSPPAWAWAETRPRWFAWAARLMGDTVTRVECSAAVYDQSVIADMPGMLMPIRSRWLADTGDDAILCMGAVRRLADAWVRMIRRIEFGVGRRVGDAAGGSPTPGEMLRDQHTMADIMRDLTPFLEQMLTDPDPDALGIGLHRIGTWMKTRVREEFEERAIPAISKRAYPPARALFTLLASVDSILEEWHDGERPTPRATTQAQPTASGHARRGRAPKPVIRSGGDLPDARFDSARQAVEWLRENGRPKAAAPPISSVCNGRTSSAYGFTWRFADAE